MKNLKRKLLSLVLAIVMLVTMIPITAIISVADNTVIVNQGHATYSLFNSGATSSSGHAYSTSGNGRNPDTRSYDNSGYDIYGDSPSYNKLTRELGLSFYVSSEITERATLTIYAYDIDEEWDQIDNVYLVNDNTNERVFVGHLSGRDSTWSTSTLYIDSNKFVVGQSYHFEVDICEGGWWTWVRRVSLDLTAGEYVPVDIIDHSFSASINNNRRVSTNLYVQTNDDTTYYLEYTATINGEQKGGVEGNTILATSSGTSLDVSFNLESGSPMGTYEIAVILKDDRGNTKATYTYSAGYAYSAVSYDSNGGSNNLPVDSNSYSSGNNVTVLFDYIPSRQGYNFLGWSTDRYAVVPEFTDGGVNSFVIGSSDVTLYAVWEEIPVVSERVVVDCAEDSISINSGIGYYPIVEFYYVATDIDPIKAMAIQPSYDSSVFELVSAEWLQTAVVQNVESGSLRSVSAWSTPTDVNGQVYKITLRAIAITASTEISAEVIVRDGSQRNVNVISKNVSIVECSHESTTITSVDETYHSITCDVCGATQQIEHSFDNNCDTDCNGGCGFTREPNHTPGASWYFDDTNHWRICEICGDTTDFGEHAYDGPTDGECNDCEFMRVMRGDFDGDWDVDSDDAIYLLSAYFFPDDYPLNQPGDIDGGGMFDSDDSIYLLSYYFFPDDYPLH